MAWFLSGLLSAGLIAALVVTAVMFLNNPERRYFRLGNWLVLVTIGWNVGPALVLQFQWAGVLLGGGADVNIQTGSGVNMWVNLALIALAGFLFYLDSRGK